MAHLRLGEVLVQAGAITTEELDRGLALQKGTKKRLGTILIDNGILTEQELIQALQIQLGIEYVDLSKMRIPVELAAYVPKNIAKTYEVVPIKVDRDDLYLAMSDPLNFYAIEEVSKVIKKRVVPVISTSGSIQHAIMILYGTEGAAKAIEDMKNEIAVSEDSDTGDDAAFTANTIGEDALSQAPTIRLVNSILERAVNERASDIHIEPREEDLRVRLRVDGLLHNVLSVPKELKNSVISRIKVMSGLDISERRVPQDGRFNIRIKDKDIDLRVSTLPTIYGEKIVLRLLDKSGAMLTTEAIGLEGEDLRKYEQLMKAHHGVVLIVGPTGSGKSSTMYTMVGELNKEEVNVATLEDPVEYNIDGVNQVQINEKTGMTFAGGLRSILRQDPDIVAVGEIRDGETAEIAMRAAITGHMVLSTIHTNDSLGTIDRLVDIGVEPYLIAGALKGIISQRLVRRICPACRIAYTPDADEVESLGLRNNVRRIFYKGAGCPECFNTGYRGRIAVFEILTIDREIRNHILNGSTRAALEDLVSKEDSDFVSLRRNAIRLIEDGTTTVEEVLRVINEE